MDENMFAKLYDTIFTDEHSVVVRLARLEEQLQNITKIGLLLLGATLGTIGELGYLIIGGMKH